MNYFPFFVDDKEIKINNSYIVTSSITMDFCTYLKRKILIKDLVSSKKHELILIQYTEWLEKGLKCLIYFLITMEHIHL